MPVYIYTTLDDPSATNGTFGNGINDAGQIVGNITNSSGNHGFLLSGGTYTAIDDPSANNQTFPEGINAAGQIAGYYPNTPATEHPVHLATTVNPPPPNRSATPQIQPS